MAYSFSDNQKQRFQSKVTAIAAALRETADDVERLGQLNPRNKEIGFPLRDGLHQMAARRILHRVIWDMANLNLDCLVSTAAEADLAIRLDAEENDSDGVDAPA